MWPDPQKTADLVTSTEEIFTGKLHFLWSEYRYFVNEYQSIICNFLKNCIVSTETC